MKSFFSYNNGVFSYLAQFVLCHMIMSMMYLRYAYYAIYYVIKLNNILNICLYQYFEKIFLKKIKNE